jgi:tetratricopeptide (TPR) repeat protein
MGAGVSSTGEERATKAFFISRSGEDKQWAKWIAWELEAAGYSVITQDWDFQPGSNFVGGMAHALDAAQTTLAVYSPAYFRSEFTEDEWTAAIAGHGGGEVRFLPVLVKNTEIPTLLKPIIYVDLVGLDQEAARRRLLDAVERRARTKPLEQPAFPGTGAPAFPPMVAAPSEAGRVRLVNAAPAGRSRFADRGEHVRELAGFLHDPDVRLVTVVGRVGIGKSALASRVLTAEAGEEWGADADGDRRPQAIVFLDSRATGLSLEHIYADLRRLVDDEAAGRLTEYWSRADVTLRESVDILLDGLGERRIIVVLDGLEGALDNGAISEDGLRTFVEACLERRDAPQLVITSRIDMSVPPEALSVVRSVRLRQGLPVADAVALLRSLDPQNDLGLADASEADLIRAVELAAGNPRGLEILAGILQDDPAASLPALLSDERALGNQVVDGLVAEAYGRLGSHEQRVLEAMAAFGAPVTEAAISFVVHNWFPEIEVRPALRRLVASYFTTATRSRGEYLLQSTDQAHAYAQIPVDSAAGCGDGIWVGGVRGPAGYHRAAVESRVADYYASVRLPPGGWLSIQAVGPQIAEFEHRVRAGEVDRALEVLDTIGEHLFLWGNYTRLVELRQLVLELPARPDLRAKNLAGLALVTQVLGQYDIATRYYEQAVECARAAHDEDAVARYTGHLGRLYRNVGYMDKALSCSLTALASAESARNAEAVGLWRDRLGLVYVLLGRLEEARELHEQAVATAREFGDRRGEGAALSNLGVVFLLLGLTDQAERAQQDALALSQAIDDRRGIAIILGRQGVLADRRRDFEAALSLHEQAWSIALELGERREQSYQLLGRGRARFGLGALDEAEADLRAARDLEMPETSYAAALALSVLLTARGGTDASESFDDTIRRCRERLDRSEGLFGARYALAIAMAGAAAWTADASARAELLAPALHELEQAIRTCHGTGAIAAVLRDVRELARRLDGLDPVIGLLEGALAADAAREP